MRRRHRILYLIDTLAVGGTERSLLEIASRLRSHEPVVCTVYRGDQLVPAFATAGIRVRQVGLKGKYSLVRAVTAVSRAIREERPALVHSMLVRSDLIARIAGKLCGIPVVNSMVSEAYGPERTAHLSRLVRAKLVAVRRLDALTAPWVDGFVANSATAKRKNCRSLGIDEGKVEVIPRGRDVARSAQVAEAEVRALRAELGLREEALILLNVARLDARKGQRDLVELMGRMRGREPRAVLLIAGDGPDFQALEAMIRDENLGDRVRLLGTRDDIPRLLAASRVFLFPSRTEGLPGSVIEAMLAGRAIVASDIDVHREMIEHGRTGFLVPPGDREALARVTLTLLGDPALCERAGSEARREAGERFDILRIVERYEQYYACLLAERAAGG